MNKTQTSLVPEAPLTLCLLHLSPAGAAGQKVRVEEELEAYPNESVDLRCMFIDGLGTKLTQVRQRGSSVLASISVCFSKGYRSD